MIDHIGTEPLQTLLFLVLFFSCGESYDDTETLSALLFLELLFARLNEPEAHSTGMERLLILRRFLNHLSDNL